MRTASTAPTRPRPLHQQTPELIRPGFRNVAAVAALGRTVFARHQPDGRAHLARGAESRDVVDEGAQRQRDHGTHVGHGGMSCTRPRTSGTPRLPPRGRVSIETTWGWTPPPSPRGASTPTRPRR